MTTTDSATHRIRLFGTNPTSDSPPRSRTTSGTFVPPRRLRDACTVSSPVTMPAMPSVMISGWTRKIPTPIPLARPTPRPTSRPRTIARTLPSGAFEAITYAAAVAVAPIERSMPRVSIAIVWPAAMMASGAA
jgi:hypothetical protein